MSANIRKFSRLAEFLHFSSPKCGGSKWLGPFDGFRRVAELKRYEERLEEELEREQQEYYKQSQQLEQVM